MLIALQNQILTVNLSNQDLHLLNTIKQQLDNFMCIFAVGLGGLFSSNLATKTTATVNTNAASLIAANPAIKGLMIKNTGSKVINIDFTNSVSSTVFFVKIAVGASYSFDTNYSGEVLAIAIGAASSAKLIEFT